jgi:protein-S-isoprenylcysteine O-methyltransferase
LTAFLLNHSSAYHKALLASVIEFTLQVLLFGTDGFKSDKITFVIGIIIVLAAQTTRSLAMHQAGVHFTHIVADERHPQHELVTSGLYHYMRHPSYCGFFWWSVGTQILLFNPLCICAYAYASFTFFRERIEYEEEGLVDFFGSKYEEFQKSTPSGVPFIK